MLYSHADISPAGNSKEQLKRRSTLAAHRLKKYKEQANANNQYAPGVNNFASGSDRRIRTQKSAPQPVVVQGPTLFNPVQIDGLTDLDALPKLKPSAIVSEVLVLLA